MTSSCSQNPFQPPLEHRPQPPLHTEPLYFGGSISEAEGAQLHDLIKGQSTPQVSQRQLVIIGICALLVIGHYAIDAIVFDDLEQLMHVGLGVAAVFGILGGAAYQQRMNRGLMAKLKRDRQGLFTDIGGRVTEGSVEYLIGDYPIRYRWEDFVGYRESEDALVLYVNYPKEVNTLAASLFKDASQWELAKATVRAHVPLLTQLPRLQKRKASSRMTRIAAGIKALDRSHWQRALTEFEKALALEPDDIQALQGRMVAAVGLQDFTLAHESIQAVVAQGSPDAITRRLRATVMIGLERYAEALDDLHWLIDQSNQDAAVLRDRGLVLYKLGQYADSIQDSTAALELDPQDGVAFNNRGAALLKLGKKEEAIVDLETAIRLAPSLDRPKELLVEANA